MYGSADMLMSYAVVGLLDEHVGTDAEKDRWAAEINAFQDKETGLYV